MTKLKFGYNKYTFDQFEILREEKRFYEALHCSRNVEDSNVLETSLFNTENVSPLTQNDLLSCEGLMTEEECFAALKDFKNAKGQVLTAFPRNFWIELSIEMASSFNYEFRTGLLSFIQMYGTISLIPKNS